ncbi:MAG: hypothetical protein ACJAQT_002854 [Akkermansiaceae bacterium]
MRCFNGKDGPGFFDQIHGETLPDGWQWVNPSKSGDLGGGGYPPRHR